jgi:hypothetical protein
MQRIRTLGLALVAVLALSVVAVSSASASSFLIHPTGKILGAATNAQVFSANGNAVSCATATVAGTATALKTLTQLVHVLYTECTAGGGLFPATVTPSALYILSADLKAALENTVTINIPAANCSIAIGPAGNQALDSVHYGNEGANLKANALVKNITFTTAGEGTLCGANGTNATYNGQFTVMSSVAGGVVRWDKE